MELERKFAWSDMFVHPDDDPRAAAGYTTERDTLVGFLRDQRLTLELKCAGLDAEAMAKRSVEPSDLSLLGLVRHMARVEHAWFRRTMVGDPAPRLFPDNSDFEGAVADPEVVAEAWALWRAEVAFAEQYVADNPDMGHVGKHGSVLRDVMVSMIEEYARHNGHADFLRERIDGRVGR
ncbi:DinB family protein [Nonomuraea sp. NPDC050556]|uniref:DinB family protein n=1 Tax=Nonomuraea sp. NPDC050556 TaxID=3364369 RepID=UPI003799DE36